MPSVTILLCTYNGGIYLEEQLNSLAKGDRVLSSGGVLGKIVEFQGKDNDIIIIDTECNGKLKMKKSFILKKLNNTKDNS